MLKIIYESLTKRDVSWYKKTCELFSKFPELTQNYESLIILFVDNLTPLNVYNQKLSQYLGAHCEQNLPPKATATARKGVGTITVRVDVLDEKSKPYCEFILLEEFCHLLDYKGDATPQAKAFWAFRNKYKQVEDHKFAEKVVHELNSHFNHFNVNRLLMKCDLNKWIDFRRAHYGKQRRQRMEPFYKKITATHDQKKSVAIILTEMVKAISFLRAVETFMQENEDLKKKTSEKLKNAKASVQNSVLYMEEYARRLDPNIQGTLAFFSQDSFLNKEQFFDKVTQSWINLNLMKQ